MKSPTIIYLAFLLFPLFSIAQVKAPSPGSLAEKYPVSKVEFQAADGLTVTGHLYEIGKENPVVLLCHQARYNKHEYADIAPRLNQMGFNCLAIDQRSGGPLAGQDNETNQRAKSQGITALSYVDAEPDILAAIDYLNEKYKQKVILWGSSYSSSLALHIAADNSKVKAVLSFSPGDYFQDKKPKLISVFPKINKPFFVTSSKNESKRISNFLKDARLTDQQIHFVPTGKGWHGSKALWNGQDGSGEYWEAVRGFLRKLTGEG